MRTSETVRHMVRNWIDQNREQIISELQGLVRIRSVSDFKNGVPRAPYGPEMRNILDFALMRAASLGLDAIDHDGYGASVYSGSLNHAIGIFAHLDVVPEGGGWVYPPYGATRVGDFLIGRGVNDNKSACAIGLMAMRVILDLGLPMRHGLRLMLGCSEETGMPDIDYFVGHEIMPDVSLVPDMTFPVNYAQKGMLLAKLSISLDDPALISFSGGETVNMVPPSAEAVLDVEPSWARAALKGMDGITVEPSGTGVKLLATGAAAHASTPEAGLNALYLLADALVRSGLIKSRAIEAVRALSGDLTGSVCGIEARDVSLGTTTMIVGLASTEDRKLTVNVDARLSLSIDPDIAESVFSERSEALGLKLESFFTGTMGKPFYMPLDDPRVEVLMDTYRTLTGDDTPAYITGGGTYARRLENAITFGPSFPRGNLRPEGLPDKHGAPHAPDEFVHIPSLMKALEIITIAILELDQI